MSEAPDNKSVRPGGRWRVLAAIGASAAALLAILIGVVGYWNIRSAVTVNLGAAQDPVVAERERKRDEQNTKNIEAWRAEKEQRAKAAAEAEARRTAEVPRADELAARREADGRTIAEAKRKSDESQQHRQAEAKAEQERQASAAEAEAKHESKESVKPRLPPILSQPSGGGVAPGGAPPQLPASLPEFPWPPPASSASWVLPKNWFESFHTLGEVVGAIVSALERNGYVEKSFFGIKEGGVALVTRLERIGDDGSSFVEPQRWPGDRRTYTNTNDLIRFLGGLFFVDPGHYRVIVFVLRDLPFFFNPSQTVTRDAARSWLISGANILPPEIEKEKFGDGRCTVLVYEFASDGRAVRLVESRLTGKEHLTRAGLLSLLAKD